MKKTLIYTAVLLIYGFVVYKITATQSYKELSKSIDEKDKLIYSLESDIESMSITIDYQQWVIEQAKDMYPKGLEKIMKDSE